MKEHVVNIESANPAAIEEIGKGGVADLQSKYGWVGEVDETMEVVAPVICDETDVGGSDIKPFEAIQT